MPRKRQVNDPSISAVFADVVDPSVEELAAMEAPVEEWDLPRVRRFWNAMVWEEMAATAPSREVEPCSSGSREVSNSPRLRVVSDAVADSESGIEDEHRGAA